MINRRDLMRSALVGAGGFGFGRIDPGFLYNSAFAAESRPVRFLGAEALTGNWDPTTHTNLGQLIVEGFVFGYLTRAPMRPKSRTNWSSSSPRVDSTPSTNTRWR